jgi:serine/threonine-protein phosphatase 6 regulatory subunit 3
LLEALNGPTTAPISSGMNPPRHPNYTHSAQPAFPHYRHSFTACEILCCELDDVLSQLVRDEDLLGQLFSLLERPSPLNSTLAGYFGRVVGSLLGKRPQQMHEYLEAHRGILDKLVAHVDTTSTVEVILRLVGADDLATSTSNEHSAWLGDTTLMTQLLDCLCAPPAGSNKLERVQRAAQHNVGNILVAIAHAQCSPMFEQLNNPIYLSRMLSQAAIPKDETHCDVLQPVLLVCIALLDPKTPRSAMAQTPMAFGIMRSFEAPPEPELVAARLAARAAAASEIVQFVPEFTKLLCMPEGAMQVQPYGTLSPPLGRQRITVVELGKALVRTQEAEAMRAMIRSDFVDRVMELFKAYPFNNILHLHVRDILGTLIQAMSTKVRGALEGRKGEETAGAPSADGAAALSAEQAEVATEIQDCLFDRVSILNWLMEMNENAESTCFLVCCSPGLHLDCNGS